MQGQLQGALSAARGWLGGVWAHLIDLCLMAGCIAGWPP